MAGNPFWVLRCSNISVWESKKCFPWTHSRGALFSSGKHLLSVNHQRVGPDGLVMVIRLCFSKSLGTAQRPALTSRSRTRRATSEETWRLPVPALIFSKQLNHALRQNPSGAIHLNSSIFKRMRLCFDQRRSREKDASVNLVMLPV